VPFPTALIRAQNLPSPGEPTGTDLLSTISYLKRKFGKPISMLATCSHAGFLLGLFFDPEDEGDMFLRNIG
jgi:hypothetical protein